MNRQIKTFDQLKDSRILYEKKLPPFGYFIIIAITFLLIAATIWSIRTPKIYVIRSTGMVQSTNKNYIMSPYTGEIININITEGMHIEKGEVLFTIKNVDLNLQTLQLQGQKEMYEKQISQYEKLVESIVDDTNYFKQENPDDVLYYNQYEAYKSQVAGQQVDVSTYKSYGYTEEQIESELIKNQYKISEIYHSTIKTVEESMLQCKTQLGSIQSQLDAVSSGQLEYTVTANATGIIHMMADYKEGMVVQATAAIASIASELDEYKILAYVDPSDVAKVKIGDSVDIAVSGLSQTIYGTITGEVVKKDSDMTTSQGESDAKSNSYFKVEVRPDYAYLLNKEGDKVNLTNGMAVETRIQYDKVTYFNYVMEALGVLTR